LTQHAAKYQRITIDPETLRWLMVLPGDACRPPQVQARWLTYLYYSPDHPPFRETE
jgi:hypothetical protein